MSVLLISCVLALICGWAAVGLWDEGKPVLALVVFVVGASSGWWLFAAVGGGTVLTGQMDRRDAAFDAVSRECGESGVQSFDIQDQDRIVYACGSVLKTRSY